MISDRNRFSRLVAVIAIAAVGFCLGPACGPGSTGSDRMPELINVYAVLSPGDSQHRVIVERAVSINEPNSPEAAAISDALVQITDGQRTVTLTPAETLNSGLPARPGSYLVDADRLPLESGGTYRLTVETPSGDIVEGETIIPAPFNIEEPDDTLRISPTVRWETSWTSSRGAHRYMLYAYEHIPGEVIDPEESMNIEYGTADTTGIVYLVFNQPGYYVLEVWAVDLNLYDYYLSRANRPELEIINHLSGGIGLFGSRVVRKRLVLVED